MRTDPNSIKKKLNGPRDVLELKDRVEKSVSAPPGTALGFSIHWRKEAVCKGNDRT